LIGVPENVEPIASLASVHQVRQPVERDNGVIVGPAIQEFHGVLTGRPSLAARQEVRDGK